MPAVTRKRAASQPPASESQPPEDASGAKPSRPVRRNRKTAMKQPRVVHTNKALAEGDNNEVSQTDTQTKRKRRGNEQVDEDEEDNLYESEEAVVTKKTARKAPAPRKQPAPRKKPAPKAAVKTLPQADNQDAITRPAHKPSVSLAKSKRKRGGTDDGSESADEGNSSAGQDGGTNKRPAAKRPRKTPQTRAPRKPAAKARSKRQPPTRSKSKTQRRGDDEDDAEEEEEDNQSPDDSDGSSSSSDKDDGDGHDKKRRRTKPKLCDFCATHPVGMEMVKTRPCDWDNKLKLECMNCANYRHNDPDSGGWSHVCHIRGQRNPLYRRYADNAPDGYTNEVCERCVAEGVSQKCDVDTTLGYGCQHCVGKDKDKNEKVCVVNGRVWQRRPNVRQGVDKWFRHPCDTCLFATKARKNHPGCSWLGDRRSWTARCRRCLDMTMSCWDGGRLVAHPAPADVVLPQRWSVTFELNGGWSELRGITPWRPNCENCGLQSGSQSHCRALAQSAMFACNLCLSFGLDCRSADGTLWPLFDLSRVGFGNSSAFPACRRCVETGRNCDRQRPCDSCVGNGEETKCDAYVKEPTLKEKQRSSFKNCIKGRVRTGPLYYLALGYGAGGVDDVKDGSRMEHWIGPPIPMYAMAGGRDDNNNGIQANSHKLRKALLPPFQPPHGGPGGHLASKLPSQITVDELVGMIRDKWPGVYPLNQHPEYVSEVGRARLQRDLLANGEGKGRVRNRGRSAADPAAVEEEDQEDEEVDYGGLGDGQAAPDVEAVGVGDQGPENDQDASGESVYGDDEQGAHGRVEPSTPRPDPSHPPPAGAQQTSGSSSSLSIPNEAGHLLNQVWEMAGSSSSVMVGDDPSYGSDIYCDDQQTEVQHQAQLLLQTQTQTQARAQTQTQHHGWRQPLGLLETQPFTGVPVDHFSEGLPVDPSLVREGAQELPAAQQTPSRWTTVDARQVAASSWLLANAENLPPGRALSQRRLFRINYDNMPHFLHRPSADTLARLEEPGMERLFSIVSEHPAAMPRCQDPGHDGGTCNRPVQPHQTCRCLDHGANGLEPAHVCDGCSQLSSDMLVDQEGSPITAAEILSMRAYLCGECAAVYSQGTGSIEQMRLNGATKVWGSTFNNGLEVAGTLAVNREDMSFHPRARPATGCPCGSKMFETRLCRAHRFVYAEKALSAVEAVRQWRRGTFGNDLCPGCLLSKPRERCNLSSAGRADGPKAWICMQCNDAVVNQPSRGLVDGWQRWFTAPPRDWLEETDGSGVREESHETEDLYDA